MGGGAGPFIPLPPLLDDVRMCGSCYVQGPCFALAAAAGAGPGGRPPGLCGAEPTAPGPGTLEVDDDALIAALDAQMMSQRARGQSTVAGAGAFITGTQHLLGLSQAVGAPAVGGGAAAGAAAGVGVGAGGMRAPLVLGGQGPRLSEGELLLQSRTRHLSPPLLAYLRRWWRLIDLEATCSAEVGRDAASGFWSVSAGTGMERTGSGENRERGAAPHSLTDSLTRSPRSNYGAPFMLSLTLPMQLFESAARCGASRPCNLFPPTGSPLRPSTCRAPQGRWR